MIGKDESTAKKLAAAIKKPGSSVPVAELFGGGGTIREITPDARRRPFSTGEFVRAHLDTANTGPGPVGHGFGADNADGKAVYYTFRIAPGITGISLDTTTDAGFADGSIGLAQYSWVESTLKRGSSAYYDFFGRKVTHSVTDELFLLFSHHTSGSMGNLLPDSRHLLDPRLDGNAFVALLKRFPNVLAWVNGHTHRNQITAHAERHAEAELLGDQHRVARRLPAAGPHRRGSGQRRRHVVAVHDVDRGGSTVRRGLRRPDPASACVPVPRAVVQRHPRRPGPRRLGRGPQHGTAARQPAVLSLPRLVVSG